MITLPFKARSLASSKLIKHELYTIKDRVLCIQGHPECPVSIVKDAWVSYMFENKIISMNTYIQSYEIYGKKTR